jgi:hypothetical protein
MAGKSISPMRLTQIQAGTVDATAAELFALCAAYRFALVLAGSDPAIWKNAEKILAEFKEVIQCPTC